MKITKYYDCLSSYGHWEREVIKDGCKVKEVIEEVPCSCHPETCNHIDGKITTINYIALNQTNHE